MKIFISLLLFSFILKTYGQPYYAFVKLAGGAEHNAYISDQGKITYEEKNGERLYPLSEGLGAVKRDGLYGFIDPLGNVIIPLQYDDAEEFSDGLAAVKINGKWGYINKKNEMVIKPTLISNKPFINKVAFYIDESMMKNNLYKFIDTTGNFINAEYYLYANKFSDNCAWVKDKNAKDWGCINTKGEYIITPKYNRVTYFKNGRCWVENNAKWGCINKKGEYIVEPIYDDTNNELNGYMWANKGGKWAMIDSTGKTVLPLEYKNMTLYALKSAFGFTKFSTPSNGLMVFNAGEKCGYYDLTFKQAIAPVFDEATNFADGLAAVKLKNKWGIIDTSGKLICEYKYKEAKYLGNGLFYSGEGKDNIVIFDRTGKVISERPLMRVKKFEKG